MMTTASKANASNAAAAKAAAAANSKAEENKAGVTKTQDSKTDDNKANANKVKPVPVQGRVASSKEKLFSGKFIGRADTIDGDAVETTFYQDGSVSEEGLFHTFKAHHPGAIESTFKFEKQDSEADKPLHGRREYMQDRDRADAAREIRMKEEQDRREKDALAREQAQKEKAVKDKDK